MTELVLTFVGGALGSSHCLGMCGGFALALGVGSPTWRNNLSRQLVYSAGRIFTYTAAGAAAAYGGMSLARSMPATVPAQAILSIVAGLFLVCQGLHAAGWWPRFGSSSPAGAGCLGGRFFGPLLAARDWRGVFLAGVFTGFLPCGLVYAFLAVAATAPQLWEGALRMTMFGLGTVPLMVVAGVGGNAMGLVARRHVFRVAAVCVALAGMVSIARGTMFILANDESPDAACPFCE